MERATKVKNGFSLVETMVAVTIIIFAILGPLSLTSLSLKTSSAARNNLIAGNLAQEGVELIRAKRGNNVLACAPTCSPDDWLDGIGNPAGGGGGICFNANGCSIDALSLDPQPCGGGPTACRLKYNSSNGMYFVGSGNPNDPDWTIFARVINTTLVDSDAGGNPVGVRVRVVISWTERFGAQSVAVEEIMFNWQQ